MKILVTGSRWMGLSYEGPVRRYLGKYLEETDVILFHGACSYGAPTNSLYKGADGLADSFAREVGWRVCPFPARPSEGRTELSSRRAGLVPRDFYLRNKEMVDECPDRVVAFFQKGKENRGTQMTYDLAEQAKLYIVKVTV